MKSNFHLLLVAALCFGGFFAYKSLRARPKTFATMQLQNVDGTAAPIPSAEPTVYILWTTWCPACQDILSKPFLQDPRIKPNVVLINDGEETDLVLQTWQARAYPFKTLLDPQRHFARAMKARSYPSFFIQNKSGRISSYEFGMIYQPDQVVDEWMLKLYKD